MSCYNKCGYDEVTRERVSELEARERLYVQTVNGVYGPFITLDFPDVTSFTELTDEVNNMSFVKEILSYTATPTTFKARVKMRNDDIVEKVFPVVSESQMGMMTPSAYSQIWINKDELASYKNNSLIVTTNVGETVTQEALTLANETVRGRDTIDGDRLLNTYDNLLFIYASGIWYPLSESATPQATNNSLGTVMGSTEPGKIQVEVDGTQSVNNWDATQEDILSKIPKTDIVTSIGETPSDIKVPSEKASKNALDLKLDKITDIVTSIGETPSDIKVPSEKASKNALDLKLDKITAPQTEVKVYTIETNGSQSIRVYSYVKENITLPSFTAFIDNNTLLSVPANRPRYYTTASMPVNGEIMNGNLTSVHSYSGENLINNYYEKVFSFPYTHRTSSLTTCSVKYGILRSATNVEINTSDGTFSNNNIVFTVRSGGSYEYHELRILGITF